MSSDPPSCSVSPSATVSGVLVPRPALRAPWLCVAPARPRCANAAWCPRAVHDAHSPARALPSRHEPVPRRLSAALRSVPQAARMPHMSTPPVPPPRLRHRHSARPSPVFSAARSSMRAEGQHEYDVVISAPPVHRIQGLRRHPQPRGRLDQHRAGPLRDRRDLPAGRGFRPLVSARGVRPPGVPACSDEGVTWRKSMGAAS